MTSAARAAEAQRLVEAWASTFREVSVGQPKEDEERGARQGRDRGRTGSKLG